MIIHSENTHASVFLSSLSLHGGCKKTAIPFFKSPAYIFKIFQMSLKADMLTSKQNKTKKKKRKIIYSKNTRSNPLTFTLKGKKKR